MKCKRKWWVRFLSLFLAVGIFVSFDGGEQILAAERGADIGPLECENVEQRINGISEEQVKIEDHILGLYNTKIWFDSEYFADGFYYRMPYTMSGDKCWAIITGYAGKKTEIVIPKKLDGLPVKWIDKSVFTEYREDHIIESVSIPKGVERIKEYAFSDCEKLTKISIPKSMHYIYEGAFNRCSNLKDVYYAGSRKQWNEILIESSNKELLKATIHYNSTLPMKNGSSSQKTPEQPVVLKNNVFVVVGGNTYCIEKEFEATLVRLGSNNKSSTIKIPDNVKVGGTTYKVTRIDNNCDSVIDYNAKVTKVTIGKNVTSIGADAFYGCENLRSVTIGAGVSYIGNEAFRGCKKLKTITIRSKELVNVGKYIFKGVKSTVTIKVPASKIEEYKALLKWKGCKVVIKKI